MSEERVLLDPTMEELPVRRPRRERPASLEGKTVGLLDITKARGDVFLDRVAERMAERGFSVKRFRKERFSMVASPEVRRQVQGECDVVIEGLAD